MSQVPSLVTRLPSIEELVFDAGEPMESWRHVQQMGLLMESLQYAWRDRDDFFVGGDVFFYYSVEQTRRRDFRGPDVLIAKGIPRRERKAWVVWLEEGKMPDVLIELSSDTTRDVDHGEKRQIYERLQIGEYFIYDPFSAELVGWRYDSTARAFVPKVADARGRMHSDSLGLGLGAVTSELWGVRAPWLRWLDAQGEPLELPAEAAVVAQARAERAVQALEEAEQERERALAERERALAERERAAATIAEYQRRFGPLEP